MNFQLCKFQLGDGQAFYQQANHDSIKANMRDGFCESLIDCENLVRSFSENDEAHQICRAITVDGMLAGSIGVFQKEGMYRKSAEIAYWLGEAYWGKGIAAAAIEQMCRMAFAHLDINRIYAEPYAHNAASRRVLEKAGFVLEGILKQAIYKGNVFYDYCVYARIQ